MADKLTESVQAIRSGANFVYHDLIVVNKGLIVTNRLEPLN